MMMMMMMMGKELQGLEESSQAIASLESLKATLKNVPNWKTPGHDSRHDF